MTIFEKFVFGVGCCSLVCFVALLVWCWFCERAYRRRHPKLRVVAKRNVF